MPLTLPPGFSQMDAESRSQALLMAVSGELEKQAKDLSNFQTLVVSLPDKEKAILGQIKGIAGLVASLQDRILALEQKKPDIPVVPKFSLMDLFKRRK